MNATRFLLAAMVLGTAIGANQANAQCSGNAGGCLTVHTASATVNALVKLGMSGTTTTLSSPSAPSMRCSFPEQLPPTALPRRRSSRQCGRRDSPSPATRQVFIAWPLCSHFRLRNRGAAPTPTAFLPGNYHNDAQ